MRIRPRSMKLSDSTVAWTDSNQITTPVLDLNSANESQELTTGLHEPRPPMTARRILRDTKRSDLCLRERQGNRTAKCCRVCSWRHGISIRAPLFHE